MAAMANRKKGDYSVLSEINTEEEWLTLLERKGLVVVDIYSDWSGPCSAMTNFLKKIKLEVNDDLLHYAMAKSDTIPQLECFRGQCKPTWLFMAGGILRNNRNTFLNRLIYFFNPSNIFYVKVFLWKLCMVQMPLCFNE